MKLRNRNIKSYNLRQGAESGVVAIFVAAVIIPLLFVLFTLSFDITTYYTGGQGVQSLADDAALYAYKFLPDKENAAKAAALFIDQNGEDWHVSSSNAVINVDSDFISVELGMSFPIKFARLFDQEFVLPIKRQARVRSTPLDTFIAMDTSAYLAPPLIAGQLPWSGDGSSNSQSDNSWPASTFFTELYPIEVNELTMNTEDEKTRVYTLLTQRCFNPVYSEVKLAAISLYDYLSSFNLNSTGLGFYPGSSHSIDLARAVLPAGLRPDTDLQPGEADFDTYYGDLYSSNVWCAGIAEHERFHNEYKFRNLLQTYTRHVPVPSPGEKMIYTDITPQFNEQYRPFLQARDVIWSRAVNSNEQTRSVQVIRDSVSALYAAQADEIRGGLIATPAKVAIIIAGDLPEEDGAKYPDPELISRLDSAVSEIKNTIITYGGNLTIYYLLLKHQGLNPANFEVNVASFEEYLKEKSQVGNDLNRDSSFKIRLILGQNPTDLVRNVLPLLMLEKRTIMIAE